MFCPTKENNQSINQSINRNKSAQGSLIAIVLGGILLTTIVASGTSWYLSMRNNLGNTEDKLEAQTIAQSEWERLSHMSLDELEANRETFKTPYSAGTGSQFSISVNLGEKGTFNNGTCRAVSGGYANCFKNTTITVYRDGSRLFTTRTLPLMAGDYTRKEMDDKLSALETKIKSEYDLKLKTLEENMKKSSYQLSLYCTNVNNDGTCTSSNVSGGINLAITLPKGYPFTIWNGSTHYLVSPMSFPVASFNNVNW